MNDGNLIKKLRIERNITQKELAAGLCSRSTLARFENNNGNIQAYLLINILERMNITFEEYASYKSNNERSKKEVLSENFSNKVLNIQHGETYLQSLYQEYNQTNDLYYLHLYCQGRIILSKVYNKEINLANEFKIIKKHLDNVDNWGFFELTMYTNSLYLFDYDQTIYQFDQVIAQINKFSNSIKIKHLKIHFLVNSIILSFEHEKPKLTTKYLEILHASSEHTDFILGRIFWKFFTGLQNAQNNHTIFDAEVTLSWLHSLGYSNLVENFRGIQELVEAKNNI
ncbi:helix-turn-helix domain-containing protein [Enterococcus lemanii]|uniref:Helix-turn-helix domain-containing protein n=1 Tax=Enterococcus lemanii TaxID=1159752 RepID=A0ABV9MVX1_9ENTE|nr:Rgg/GadR/MutR family transcriptional regulator [Enterococcus lemanii]MBM7708567.1 Rgg/GadR/MutR family transcriptional activator [Enterococcus lemanii]